MRFVELFAGIGGFRYGLKGHECVWANEWDKYASQIYRKNYGEGELYEGDITTVNTNDIPEHDLLVGGFPCQAFSIAGKRAGFDDTRGTLFFEVARILRNRRSRCVLLENVKGLLSHDSGQTFQTILKVLSDLGYRTEWQVLNSKDFGVPHKRERVFIVGHLRGQSSRQVFPIGQSSSGDVEIQSGEDRKKAGASCLDSRYGQRWTNESYIKVRSATKKGYEDAGEGDSINLSVLNSKTRRGRVGKGVAQTIDTGMQQHTIQGRRIRRLTPTECERLQGFPDGWTKYGMNEEHFNKLQELIVDISDTQRYKCLGNAVTTNVITEIGKRL